MNAKADQFLREWRRIAGDLGLDVIGPYRLQLPSGKCIDVPALLRGFGAECGMLLVLEFSSVADDVAEILGEGFGFSTLSLPSDGGSYDDESILMMLRDWGWAGSTLERPSWL